MTGTEFTDKYGHKRIEKALNMFSYQHTKKLPRFLIKDKSDGQIMLDTLKISGLGIVLPVIIRSTNWLRCINEVSGVMLQIYLHEERWPTQNRFELVGGLSEISEDDIQGALFRYLENSIEYWKSREKACAIFVSERVKEVAKSSEFKKLLRQVEVIELSKAYKEKEIVFF